MGTPTWLFRLPQVASTPPSSPGWRTWARMMALIISLSVVLPLLPVTPRTGIGEALAPGRGHFLQRLARIGHHHLGQRQRLGALHHRGDGAALGSRHHERRGVVPHAPQGHEELAGLDAARVGAHGVEAHVGADEPAARRLRDPGEGGHRHALPPCAGDDRAARATSTSENGRRVCPVTCTVSCPLPAMSTASPGRASRIARPIAAARSGTTCRRSSVGAPARMSAMICCGILGARVVVGDDDAVGAGDRRLPHRRALAPVPVAAAAEHAPDLARAVLADGGQRLPRARRACGRNPRAPPAGPAAPATRSMRPGGAPQLPSASATRSSGQPEPSRIPAATSRFSALKRPQSGLAEPRRSARHSAGRGRGRRRPARRESPVSVAPGAPAERHAQQAGARAAGGRPAPGRTDRPG